MAEAALLDWFVSPLISKLVQKGFSILEDGLKGKLENLHTMVPQIKQVIEKAEMLGKEDDKQLMVWMRELQDAAYEADNVLEEYDYELLKRQAAQGKFVKAIASPPLSFLSNASFRSKLRDCLEKLDKIASRVHTFTNMLGGMSINASSLADETTFVTGSEPTEPQIFGRDAERDHILDLLINNHVVASESDDHLQKDVPVLPIVGVGGVGKTTLAQCIYNDPKIIAHFPKRMWIHTPQNFDEIMITKRMVESVSQDACPAIDNFATLQQSLHEGLQKKRFLLVLDDVWYDEKQSEFVNRERWWKLLAPLRHAVQGSVVLITSRIDLVAMTFGNAMQTIRLEGLNEHDCSSLFNRHAFEAAAAAAAACGQQKPDNQNEHHHLMEIGTEIARKIVSKLGGLPLAAKVLGGMLRNKHDVEEWNKVLRIDIWDDITRVLTLSYKRLPPLLRQCVAHHGLYPKGFSLSGDYLVRAWIAAGFISAAQHDERQESGYKSMEEIGSNCLNELVFRSFLQPTNDGRFILHDLMHDVADSVSRHECIRILKGEKKKAIPPTTKHLFIHVKDLDKYKESICRLGNLRTLFLLCNLKSKFTLDHGVLHSILTKSKRLRTLDLAGCRMEKLPDCIGDLKHLRFLDLSQSTVKSLPKSFHRLYHLLYLDLSMCKLDSVPKGLSELINLRHLEAEDTTFSMIPNLGRLTALQELKEFHVKKEKGHEAGQLRNLANLRGTLHIVNLENIISTSEANEAKLHDKTHLREVWLEWGEENTTSNSDSAEMVLDGFQPPSNISSLGIKWYVGSRAPIWMQPNNLLCGSSLHTLILQQCVGLESLPPLSQLFPNLRELRLKCCYQISHLPHLPPNLTTLELSYSMFLVLLTEEDLKISTTDGPQLEFVQALEKSQLFKRDSVTDSLEQNPNRIVNVEEIRSELERTNPCHNPSETILSNIIFWVSVLKFECIKEKLKMPLDAGNVQQLPSSLQHLNLFGIPMDGATLSDCLSRLPSLSTLNLAECTYLISLPSREVLSNLRRLQEVIIFRCKMLISLGGLAALPSLEKLIIMQCPNLMIVVPSDEDSHGALLPESLTDLTIYDCGFLDTYMGRCLMGLTRLSELQLSQCQNMTSLPTAEELMHLTSLHGLRIEECDQLVSVGGLHVLLSSLQILGIFKCPRLFGHKSAADVATDPDVDALSPPDGFSRDLILAVDNLSMLPLILLSRKGFESLTALALFQSSQDTAFTREQEEWFQHLHSLRTLMIHDCEQLPSLPSNLTSLTRLKELCIQGCPQVSSLPTLPMCLESLEIEGYHPELEQRCREGGPDWDLIKHIPDIEFI
ncbi:hypothetical protein J5N97_027671 [Dioscorea zingiberensis]|uniref:Uncharacterized protein n=1 Tax=Dioscorea zingiberensis TaxID=325984 RepID=A0A9D5BXN4_9LILI|nr:hypothetical protein J5N97_027671 [Dioscorea zingiberensis]